MKPIVVNSSNYITTNFNLSKLYLAQNIEIENMEFFSVLKVAKEFNIPAKGILIVTNYCNRDAHKDFIKNHKKAIELLTNYIKKEEIWNQLYKILQEKSYQIWSNHLLDKADIFMGLP